MWKPDDCSKSFYIDNCFSCDAEYANKIKSNCRKARELLANYIGMKQVRVYRQIPMFS